jgi:hypothetical protein
MCQTAVQVHSKSSAPLYHLRNRHLQQLMHKGKMRRCAKCVLHHQLGSNQCRARRDQGIKCASNIHTQKKPAVDQGDSTAVQTASSWMIIYHAIRTASLGFYLHGSHGVVVSQACSAFSSKTIHQAKNRESEWLAFRCCACKTLGSGD